MEFPVDESPGGYVWKTAATADRQRHCRGTPFSEPDCAAARKWRAVVLRRPADDGAADGLGRWGSAVCSTRVYQERDISFMQEVAKQIAVAVDNVLHEESARTAQSAPRPRARSVPPAARGEQRRRLEAGHGCGVRIGQHVAAARDPARWMQPAALRARHAAITVATC